MTGWVVRVGEWELHERELTVAQAVDISRLAGGGWETLDPTHSPAAAAAIVTALLVAHGAEPDEAAMKVNVMPALDLLACVVAEEGR